MGEGDDCQASQDPGRLPHVPHGHPARACTWQRSTLGTELAREPLGPRIDLTKACNPKTASFVEPDCLVMSLGQQMGKLPISEQPKHHLSSNSLTPDRRV